MRKILLSCLLFMLPFSIFADEDTWNLVRGILAPSTNTTQPSVSVQTVPRVTKQYPCSPDYPDVYLGDNGSELESIFLEMVLYGQAQQGNQHFVVLSGRSSAGVFQKKISFSNLDELLHFQGILENKQYDRIYFHSDGKNEADYLLLKSPRRDVPTL